MAMCSSGFATPPSFCFNPTRSPSWHAFLNPFIKSKRRDVPEYVEVEIEVSKGSGVKRRPDGTIDTVVPFPCPFNYGSVPSVIAPDGDPLDAIVLGDYLPYRHKGTWKVRGMIKFTDNGLVDNKLVCIQQSPRDRSCTVQNLGRESRTTVNRSKMGSAQDNMTFSRVTEDVQAEDLNFLDLLQLSAIFSGYVVFKGAINAFRGKYGPNSFDGWEIYD